MLLSKRDGLRNEIANFEITVQSHVEKNYQSSPTSMELSNTHGMFKSLSTELGIRGSMVSASVSASTLLSQLEGSLKSGV